LAADWGTFQWEGIIVVWRLALNNHSSRPLWMGIVGWNKWRKEEVDFWCALQ
jgi:hypothetical protein